MHAHTAVPRTEQKSPSAPLRRPAPTKNIHAPLGISGTTAKGDTCSSTGVWGMTGVRRVNEFLVAIPVFWFIIGVLGTANAMKNEYFWCVEHHTGLPTITGYFQCSLRFSLVNYLETHSIWNLWVMHWIHCIVDKEHSELQLHRANRFLQISILDKVYLEQADSQIPLPVTYLP